MTLLELLVKISADTSGLDKGLDSGLGKIKSGLSTLGSFATKAVAGAATAVAAFTAASIKTGMDFDTAMSQVAATMGMTVDQMNSDMETVTVNGETFTGNLTEFAEHMGATTQYTAKQSADALNYMALAGYDTKTAMQMLPNVMNLAAAGAMDLATASDMVTDAQTALGLSIDDTNVMVDRMAKTASKSNTSVQQLGDAFLTVGANAKSMGSGLYDTTQEASQVLGILADNGIKASEAGTHLRNILLACNPPTDDAAAAWKQLGVSAYDADGNLRDLQFVFSDLSEAMKGMTAQQRDDLITKMFNKTDLAAVNSLLDTSVDRWSELADAIAGAWYSSDSLESQLKGKLNISLDEMKQNLEKLGVTSDDFSHALDNCNGDVEEFAAGLFEDTDAGVEVSDVTKALGGNLGKLQAAFDGATGSAQAMAETQLDNLSGDITYMQSAFEGLQISVSDLTTGTLREFVQFASNGLSNITLAMKAGGPTAAIKEIANILPQGIQMVVSKLPTFINAGIQILGAVGQGLMQAVPSLVSGAAQIAAQLFTAFITYAPKLLEAGADMIRNLSQGLSGNVTELINKALPMIMEFSANLRANAGELISAGLEMIVQLAQGIINALPTIIETVPTIIDNMVNIINDNAPKMLATGLQLIVMLVAGLIQAIPVIIQELPKIIKCIWDTITAVNWVSLGSQIITAFKNGITAMVPLVKGGVTHLKDNIIAIIKQLPGKLKELAVLATKAIANEFRSVNWGEIGMNVIRGIANGITSAISWVVDAAKSAAKAAFDAAKDFLGIHSPSTLMRDQVGKYISLGMAAGIDDYSDSAVHSMESMAQNVSDAATVSMQTSAGGSTGSMLGSYGPISINVYARDSDSLTDLAERVSDVLGSAVSRRRAVFA